MTRPEPAGVGTADEMAERIIRSDGWCETRATYSPTWIDFGVLRERIASAITASRRQALEKAEGVAKALLEGDDTESAKDVARVIAAGIRLLINPPGEKE